MRSNADRLVKRLLGAACAIVLLIAAHAYNLSTDSTGVYVVTWDPGVIAMQVKLPTAPALSDGTSQGSSVAAAMQEWNSRISTVQFDPQMTSPGACGLGNLTNEIVMDSAIGGQAFGSGVLAVTVSYRSYYSRVESDIVFNNAYTWNSYRGPRSGPEDIRRVAIHELGHVLGLLHPDEASPPQSVVAIMNRYVSNIDTMQADDIAGAQALYGSPGVVPPNDNFADATVINLSDSGSVKLFGTNVAATVEPNEPDLDASDPGHRTVWWRWVAPAPGVLSLTTHGSRFDTLLGVYTGNTVNSLTLLARNDESGSVHTSALAIMVTAGTTYHIAVDGWAGYMGSIQLNAGFLSMADGPIIAIQAPARHAVLVGSNVTLQSSVIPTGQVQYQWHRNGWPIAGETGSSLERTNLQVDDSGWYQVFATDQNGTTRSRAVFVAVSPEATQVRGWGSNSVGQLNVPAGIGRVTAVSAGYAHGLALKLDGTVVAWGDAGDSRTAVPAGLKDVVAVAAGGAHSLALKSDGTVVAWGYNAQGQATVPVGLTGVVAIAAGTSHSLALKGDGTVVGWGANGDGQANPPPNLSGVVAIAGGDRHSMALKSDGTVVAWGYNAQGQATVPANLSNVRSFDAGCTNSLAVTAAGDISIWGDNFYGQTTPPGGLGPVLQATTNNYYTAAIRSDRTVTAWGHGPTEVPADVTKVLAIAGSDNFVLTLRDATTDQPPVITQQPVGGWRAVGGSFTFTVAATGVGPLTYAWSREDIPIAGATSATLVLNNLQVGDSGAYKVSVSNHAGSVTSAPAILTVDANLAILPGRRVSGVPGQALTLSGQMENPSAVVSIVWKKDNRIIPGANQADLSFPAFDNRYAGAYTMETVDTNAVTRRATTFVIPDFGRTQMRRWASSDEGTRSPNSVSHSIGVAAADFGTLILNHDGSVVRLNPTGKIFLDVPATATGVVQVAAGRGHFLALRSDGTVVAWGDNLYGQTTVPAGLSGVIAVAAGFYNCVALRSDGTVVAWGANSVGQSTVPAGLTEVSRIAACGQHVLALRSDGTVVAWGDNSYGQTTVPVGLTNVVEIGSGGYHSLAIREDGTLAAWGSNSGGQLNIPADLGPVVTAVGGDFHTLVQLADGHVRRWGVLENAGASVPADIGTVVAVSARDYASTVLRSAANDAAPTLTNPPVGATRAVGEEQIFSVTASGASLLTYQWNKDGVPIARATGTTLTLQNLSLSDAGSYTVTVENHIGSTTSAPAILTVNPRPVVKVAGTTRRMLRPGQGTTLEVIVGGVGTLSYQWYFNGRPIPGATSQTLTLSNVQNGQGGAYFVRVADSLATATSAPFFVIVSPSVTQVMGWGSNASGVLTPPTGLNHAVGVSAGINHAVAINEDGTAVAWGDTQNQRPHVTELPANWANLVAVAAGDRHTLALRADGTVVVSNWASSATTVPAGLENVMAIAACWDLSLALRTDGTVVAWGSASTDQVPVGLGEVSAVAAGAGFAVALKSNGSVVAWGNYNYQQTSVPPDLGDVIAIAAGWHHVLALKSDGTVVSWGDNTQGQATVPASLNNVVEIAAGDRFSIARKADGTVVAWGAGSNGESPAPVGLASVLGVRGGQGYALALRDPSADPPPHVVTQPVDVTVLEDQPFSLSVEAAGPGPLFYRWRRDHVDIAGATQSTYSRSHATLADAGSYDVVVSNHIGSVISSSAVVTINPAPQVSIQGAARRVVDAGGSFSLVSSATGQGDLTYQWYHNGQPIPGATSPTLSVDQADSGDAGAYALLVTDQVGFRRSSTIFVLVAPPEGVLRAWGRSDYGLTSPPVGSTPGEVVQISAAIDNAAALLRDGTVRIWGSNYKGFLYPPAGLENLVEVSLGGNFAVVLRADGTVTAWGNNDQYGVISDAAILSEIIAVSAGGGHGLALRMDGTVAAWGSNSNGQANVPAGLADAVAVSAGDSHSYALRADGTVVGWGSNIYGETTTPAGLSQVVAISAGISRTLALKADGTIVGWGRDNVAAAVIPSDLGRIRFLFIGGSNSVAIKLDGTIAIWGTANYGANDVPANASPAFAAVAGVGFGLALTGNTNVVAPTVVTQPVGQTKSVGTVATFAVVPAGSNRMVYQWQRNGVALTDGGSISGSRSPVLTVGNVQSADAGNYDVVISNLAGIVTSNPATLAVNMASQTINFGTLPDRPFSQTPISLTASASSGLPVQFTVASGPATVSGSSLTLTGAGLVTIQANQAGNSVYAAAQSVIRSFNVTPNLGSWSVARFSSSELADAGVSGPTADPDGDGLSNLVEYALGLEPKSVDTTGLPEITVTATDWVYTYKRPADRADLTYAVECTTNLAGTWSTSGVTHEFVSSSSGVETWRGRYPLASVPNAFFRLKIETN